MMTWPGVRDWGVMRSVTPSGTREFTPSVRGYLCDAFRYRKGQRPSDHPPGDVVAAIGTLERQVPTVATRLRGLRLLPGHHDVQQLPDEPERIDLVVMLPGREAHQLRLELGTPRR